MLPSIVRDVLKCHNLGTMAGTKRRPEEAIIEEWFPPAKRQKGWPTA